MAKWQNIGFKFNWCNSKNRTMLHAKPIQLSPQYNGIIWWSMHNYLVHVWQQILSKGIAMCNSTSMIAVIIIDAYSKILLSWKNIDSASHPRCVDVKQMEFSWVGRFLCSGREDAGMENPMVYSIKRYFGDAPQGVSLMNPWDASAKGPSVLHPRVF